MANIGYIYSITPINNTDDNDVYYGSTININLRWSTHKSEYKFQNKRDYYTIFTLFEKYGIDNCQINILEQFDYNDKSELRFRERYYIENNNCINIKIPQKTKDEKKDYMKKHSKIWYENNKEYYKEYREKNKDYLFEYNKHQEIKNKENREEQRKIRYEKRMSEKIICEFCNSITNQRNIKTHQKTKKCTSFQNKL
jgi:hypothetical protein